MFDETVTLKTNSPAPYLPLATLPPTAKLAAGFSFAIAASMLSHHAIALIACLIPLLLALGGRLPLLTLGKKLIPINFFFIFLWVFLPLKLSLTGLEYTRTGVELAALITLKGNAIAATLLILLGTSTVSQTCRGLLKLHLPEKLVTLLLLTYTNLAYMKEEYTKIANAAKLRGFTPARSWHSYKTTAYLIAMLLIRSWQKAQRIGKAMRLRGFSGKYPLLDLPPSPPYSNCGILFFSSLCIISVLLILANTVLQYF